MDYDEHNPFVICSKTFVPLYRGKPQIKCPFCEASYLPDFKDTLCNVCDVAKIGADSTGLKICTIDTNKK